MGITISVNLDEFREAIDNAKSLGPLVLPRLWEGTIQVANELNDEVKDGMPVDTGRAKAGWGHYTPEDLTNATKSNPSKSFKNAKRRLVRGSSGRTEISSPDDAIWEEHPDELLVIQGTNVPYTVWINDGSQGRSGTHHIDLAFMRLEEKIDQWMQEFLDWKDSLLAKKK